MALFIRPQILTLISSSRADVKFVPPTCPWHSKTNPEKYTDNMIDIIRKRKLRLFEHICRMHDVTIVFWRRWSLGWWRVILNLEDLLAGESMTSWSGEAKIWGYSGTDDKRQNCIAKVPTIWNNHGTRRRRRRRRRRLVISLTPNKYQFSEYCLRTFHWMLKPYQFEYGGQKVSAACNRPMF